MTSVNLGTFRKKSIYSLTSKSTVIKTLLVMMYWSDCCDFKFKMLSIY